MINIVTSENSLTRPNGVYYIYNKDVVHSFNLPFMDAFRFGARVLDIICTHQSYAEFTLEKRSSEEHQKKDEGTLTEHDQNFF